MFGEGFTTEDVMWVLQNNFAVLIMLVVFGLMIAASILGKKMPNKKLSLILVGASGGASVLTFVLTMLFQAALRYRLGGAVYTPDMATFDFYYVNWFVTILTALVVMLPSLIYLASSLRKVEVVEENNIAMPKEVKVIFSMVAWAWLAIITLMIFFVARVLVDKAAPYEIPLIFVLLVSAIFIGVRIGFWGHVVRFIDEKLGSISGRIQGSVDNALGVTNTESKNESKVHWATFWKEIFLCIGFIIMTNGIGYAWAITWIRKYVYGNTYINGKQLVYTGKGTDYFIKVLVWGLLSGVTAGIYGAFFVPVRMQEYKLSHLHFVGQEGVVGVFHGKVLDTFINHLLAFFLIGIFWGIPFGYNMLYRYKWQNWEIGGTRFEYTGTPKAVFSRIVTIVILGIITLDLWTLFAFIGSQHKWEIERVVEKQV